MKIAILYICTGSYSEFFEAFYMSSKQYFLPEVQKHFFVWTDNEGISFNRPDVFLYYKSCEGFPKDSLFKFKMFLQAADELKEYDYIYFFNSNSLFTRPVGEEILPNETGLAMGVWPGRRERQHPMFYPYERNKKSLAYIPPFQKNYRYYMGGINGGTSDEYLKMIRVLACNIQTDYENGIIAKVHDESHINAYLRKHPCKALGPEFCWPEEWKAEGFEPKIILRDKVKTNASFNKGRKSTLFAKVKKGINYLLNAIRWYIRF